MNAADFDALVADLDDPRAIAHWRELRVALAEAQTTLIWASGAFRTEEEHQAWVTFGNPVLERARKALT